MTPFAYIRDRYKVPARRGARVRLDDSTGGGDDLLATVLSATLVGHIYVRIDGRKRRFGPIHPTAWVTWLEQQEEGAR